MKPIRSDGVDSKAHGPHPEEPCEARRLEGWTLARSCLWPSFETRESKSAVADFDTIGMPKSGRPDFGARSSGRGCICAATVMASLLAGAIARADDFPSYCAELRQIAAAALAKDKFAGIVGNPRAGNFLDATVALPGWEDCAFYGLRTYTCDSHGLETAEEGDRALAKILGEVKTCLRDGWAEDQSRASPGYVVLHDTRQVAAITINNDRSERGEHIVRLILFLRSR
jgi:hypothetical protein